mmetsp:Transcript_22527/g.35013  ORF Transcript_22527/g.35013 Transcript_22527/m.35013 type:complete len:100 (+) Transcript_22527:2-301(+)
MASIPPPSYSLSPTSTYFPSVEPQTVKQEKPIEDLLNQREPLTEEDRRRLYDHWNLKDLIGRSFEEYGCEMNQWKNNDIEKETQNEESDDDELQDYEIA